MARKPKKCRLCKRQHHARGLCLHHYTRWKRGALTNIEKAPEPIRNHRSSARRVVPKRIAGSLESAMEVAESAIQILALHFLILGVETYLGNGGATRA